jgi:hypothetical protein
VEVNAVEESYPDKQLLVTAGRHGAVRGTNVLTTEAEQVHRCLEEGTITLGKEAKDKSCRSVPRMVLTGFYFSLLPSYRTLFKHQVLERYG